MIRNPFKKHITEVLFQKSTALVDTARRPITSVQVSILLAMEAMINKLDTELTVLPERVVLPMPEEIHSLIAAGFTNTKSVQDFLKKQQVLDAEYNVKHKKYTDRLSGVEEVKAALLVLLKAREAYGQGTLLIPFEQFKAICKRHNLVCGTFNEYNGEVPADKLSEIVRLKSCREIYEHNPLYKVTTVTKTGFGDAISRTEYTDFDEHFDKEMPFVRERSNRGREHVTFLDGVHRGYSFIELEVSKPDLFFIAAPREMMRQAEVREVFDPRKDPIIFGLAGNNVLLFTRWGEEANDKTIQRFEAFNQKLNAFAESLEYNPAFVD